MSGSGGDQKSGKVPGRHWAALWQHLPTASLEPFTERQPSETLLTPVQYLLFPLEPQLLASEERGSKYSLKKADGLHTGEESFPNRVQLKYMK